MSQLKAGGAALLVIWKTTAHRYSPSACIVNATSPSRMALRNEMDWREGLHGWLRSSAMDSWRRPDGYRSAAHGCGCHRCAFLWGKLKHSFATPSSDARSSSPCHPIAQSLDMSFAMEPRILTESRHVAAPYACAPAPGHARQHPPYVTRDRIL